MSGTKFLAKHCGLDNNECFHAKAGRSPRLSVIAEITKVNGKKNALDGTQLVSLENIHRSSRRFNRLSDDACLKTITKFIVEVPTASNMPQIITKARQVVCSDERMTDLIWIQVPQLIWNSDAVVTLSDSLR